ncbi:MAG TPA: hypothetical protein VN915_14380, partial [Elusimicrobiota bacterium]|nr:hypothetical protein [Elusimicrobiota bacterium]
MNRSGMRRSLLALAAAAAGLLAFSGPARAQIEGLNGPSDTSLQGRRVIFTHPNLGRTYVFFEAADGVEYISRQGTNWTNPLVAISTTEMAGNVNPAYPSIYFDQVSSTVWVISSDPAADQLYTASTQNSVFMKAGTINNDGSITWGTLVQKNPFGTVGGNLGDCMAGLGSDIALVGTFATGNVGFVCDAEDGTAGRTSRTSFLGQSGLNTDLSGAGTTLAPDGSNAYNEGSGAPPQYAAVTPVTDAGNTPRMLVMSNDRADETNNTPRIVSYTGGGAYTLEQTPSLTTLGTNANESPTITSDPLTPSAYAAWINSTGGINVMRRTAFNTWAASYQLDGCGAAGATLGCSHPSLALVKNSNMCSPVCDELVLVYVSSYGAINYAVGPATATSSAFFTFTTNFDGTGTGGNDVPMVPRTIFSPDPVPLTWTGSGGQEFDYIPISTFPAPNVTSISSAPATAPVTTNTYDLVINGTGFYNQSSTKTISVELLIAGQPQTQISITSVTFVSGTQLRASVVITPGSLTGNPFDLEVENPDGKYKYLTNAITVNPPTLTNAWTVGASSNSAGIEPAIPEGTARPTRQLTLTGTNFEKWGVTTASITVSGATGVSVASVTYTNSTTFVANLNVSTSASAGVYAIRVVNSDGLTSTLLASTFTVTLPTATLSYPSTVQDTFFNTNSKVYYSSGIVQLQGNSWYLPQSTQTALLSSQVKITQNSDGQIWSGSGYLAPASFASPQSENQWLNADSAANPWTYSAWPIANQSDGVAYNVAVRAQTKDNGWSFPISSFTVVIAKSLPTPQVTSPVGGTVVDAQNIVSLSADDQLATGAEGPGVTKLEVVIQDTATPTGYWTGSSWTFVGGPYWLTSAVSPVMQFNPPAAPVSANLLGSTAVSTPTWHNGAQYLLQAAATDAFGHRTTGPVASFYYDVSNPTVTLTSVNGALTTLSSLPASPTWLNSVTSLSGAINDVVMDLSNTITVYVQITDITGAHKFLTAADTFTATNATNADNYWYIPYAGVNGLGTWTQNITGVPWTNGHSYRIAFYACNSAGLGVPNAGCTGNNGSNGATDTDGGANNPPAAVYFFNISNVPPFSGQIFPTTGGSPNAFGNNVGGALSSVSTLFGTAQDGGGGAGIHDVEYTLQDNNTGNYWCNPASTAMANPGAPCNAQAGPGFIAVGGFPQVVPWVVAVTSTSVPWSVWTATGIPFPNGHSFTFITRAVDNAGNYQLTYTTRTFIYDSSPPNTVVTYPASGATYSAQLT